MKGFRPALWGALVPAPLAGSAIAQEGSAPSRGLSGRKRGRHSGRQRDPHPPRDEALDRPQDGRERQLRRLYGNYAGTSSTDEVTVGGNLQDVAQQQVGQTTRPGSGVTRSWDLDELMFDSRGHLVEGRLATDRPHVFKLYGSYRFGFGATVGAYVYAGSGTPVSKVVRTRNGVPPFVDGRGSLGRTDFLTNTDLFLSQDIKLGGGGRLLRLELKCSTCSMRSRGGTSSAS